MNIINVFDDILNEIIIQDNYVDIIDDVLEYETPHDCACDCDLCLDDYQKIMIEQDRMDRCDSK